MDYASLNAFVTLSEKDKEECKKLIQKCRGKLIKKPNEIVEVVFKLHPHLLEEMKSTGNISKTIEDLRELAYEYYLKEESDFNVEVLKQMAHLLNTPSEIFDAIQKEKLDLTKSQDEIIEQIKLISVEYSGRIAPYIYELSLSNTNARRSRAGKTFEAIIYRCYEEFGFSYDSQRAIGKQHFQVHGLGKIVDSILPGINEFTERRDKCIIGTMKTTLRERWQEVVEELNRTGLPSIHLLTMDEDISESKAEQIGKHNLILVVHERVKQQKELQSKRNIISFETYFTQELGDMMSYWNR